MSVGLDGDTIRLSGAMLPEDAEALLSLLQADRRRAVDVREAGHLHAALVQVILAFRPVLIGVPADAFAAEWLMPLLANRD